MIFTAAPVTLLLILVNVLVSGYVLFGDQGLMDRLSFRPQKVLRERQYHRLITAGFVHVGLGHLLFNMLTLFFFGPSMEVRLGSGGFLLLYFGSELAAHGLTLLLHRGDTGYAAVGASGAVSGVLFGYCLFEPLSTLLVFFLPMPAIVFAVVYVFGSIYAMRQRDRGMTGGIAHEAHLGGAVGGVLITLVLRPDAFGVFLNALGMG